MDTIITKGNSTLDDIETERTNNSINILKEIRTLEGPGIAYMDIMYIGLDKDIGGAMDIDTNGNRNTGGARYPGCDVVIWTLAGPGIAYTGRNKDLVARNSIYGYHIYIYSFRIRILEGHSGEWGHQMSQRYF